MKTKSRTRSRTPASQRAKVASRAGALKIVGVILIVVGVAAYYIYIALSHHELDKETLCPAEPVSITVLLVDVTDPMNIAQRQDFLNQLERLKHSIPRYGKLIVMKVDSSADRLLVPGIIRCNPGTAADVDQGTADPLAIQKQWDEGFDKPLTNAFAAISQASGSEHSPILESIQSAALTEFQKPTADGKPRRLIVASDLLQNTRDISFYRLVPKPADFVVSPQFTRVRTSLTGVDVELWMLQRADFKRSQPRSLADLWERIITQQGGNLTRVYNVSG